jgi:hypothetical protein
MVDLSEIRLVTSPEAAKAIGISYSLWRSLEATGATPIKPVVLGHWRRYRTAEIRAFLEGTAMPAPLAVREK